MSKVLWMLALIIIAIYVRVQGVNGYHYSEDEIMHIQIAQGKSLKEVLQFSFYEAHPPLGHILRWYWLKISDAIWFSRSLSLLFGIGTILVYYRIGRILNDDISGLCCAWLAAFSYGGIVQSYVARNYSILTFFLTLSLYYYLLWQSEHKGMNLLKYALCAVLGGFTHFSAILAIFPIAAYETCAGYLENRPLKQQTSWAVANIAIAVLLVAVYLLWSSMGTVFGAPYFHTTSWLQYMSIVAFNPLLATAYILPSIYITAIIIPLFFLPLHKQKPAARRAGFSPLSGLDVHQLLAKKRINSNFRATILLAGLALGLSTAITAAMHYYPAGTRHNIWLMPFIIPAAGLILANGVRAVFTQISTAGIYITAIVVLLGGYVLFDQKQRLDDHGEYQMKESDWQEMVRYTENLDSTTLIIAARDDAITFENLYPDLGDNAFSVKSMATLVPYRNTHILFNPYFRRFPTKEILVSTLDEAVKRGMFEDVDTLLFLKTDWDVYAKQPSPLFYLASCLTLDKKIIPFAAGSGDERANSPVAFITVSKKDFLEQVLAPDGKAHDCLGE